MGRSIIRWPLALGAASIPVLTVAAAFLSLLGDASGDHSTASNAGSATRLYRPASSFASAERRVAAAPPDRPATALAPTLEESLIAADILNLAGRLVHRPPAELTALAAAAPPATLEQSLIAADELNQAGVMMILAEPPLIEVLEAATILADAGVISIPPPSSGGASVVAPPPAPEPPPAPTESPSPPPEPTPTPEPSPSGASGWLDADFSAAVLDSVNALRATGGIGPLVVEPRLTAAAAGYAQMLAEYNWFDHVGPDGSTLVDRIVNAGFPFDVQVGEVIAWGQDEWPAASIAQAWLDSPPHYEQIMEPIYTRAGIGCYFTNVAGRLDVRCVMDLAG